MRAPALGAHLRERRDAGAKLLVPYLMAGQCTDWVEVAQALAAAGADAIEVGLPFSDPIMDGPIIQRAAEVALQAGTTPASVLAQLRHAELGVPVVVMTYYNLVLRAGLDRMAGRLAEAGVAGVILADLPLEELDPWAEVATPIGIETVLLLAPSTSPTRAARIGQRTQGFCYAVGRMGVTGERQDLGPAVSEVTQLARSVTTAPVLVGVGVSTPAQAAEVASVADGAIVGSALVRRLLEGAGPEVAAAFLTELRCAVDR